MNKLVWVLAVSLLSMGSAQAQSRSAEGSARQIQSLKAAMEAFSASARAQIAANSASITENVRVIESFETCAESGMMYAPEDAAADANGCKRVTASQALNEIDVSAQLVATSRWLHPYHFTEHSSNGSPSKRGRSYAQIYRIDDLDNYNNYLISGNLSGGGSRSVDHGEVSCWNANAYVKIGSGWVSTTGDAIKIEQLANVSKTRVGGQVYNGKFQNRIAIVKRTASSCYGSGGGDLNMGMKVNYITYHNGMNARASYYDSDSRAPTLRITNIIGY